MRGNSAVPWKCAATEVISMSEYEFTLILSEDLSDFDDNVIDALFEAGCDDATIAQRYGRIHVTFSRESRTLADAVMSAIRDVRKSRVCRGVLRVDASNLVTQAEIARRLGRTRQSVGQYISGERGPGGFPPPACNVVEGQPLWQWCEVTHWLARHNLIAPAQDHEAQELAAINTILELEYLRQVAPEMTQRILTGMGASGPLPRPPAPQIA
jgi:molybdopterin-guanine dinucleotide biosynthesis protein A